MIRNSRLPLRVLFVLAPVMLLAGQVWAQRGAVTQPRALDQLTAEASTIVRGHVISARVEPHPQLSNITTVVVSMHVDSTLTGTAGKTLEFRQYIWDIRDQLDAARYAKGQELLLMLGPVSRYGLTSPVGLEQGRFRIKRDSNGKVTAVNGRGNQGLFDSIEQRAKSRGLALTSREATLVRQSKGAVAVSDLEDMIRTFARTR